jgi:hypothetical protein
VPDAVGAITIRADLRARRTLTSVSIDAPREGRAKARINWMLRQLAAAPDELVVEVAYPSARQTTSALLGDARAEPERLLYPQDPRREPKSFTLTLGRSMGQKRGKGDGSFVRETRAQTFDFYGDLVQNLKSWQARAPKLRDDEPEPVAELEPTSVAAVEADPGPQPVPPAFGSDERDPGDAPDPLAANRPSPWRD